MLRALIPLSPLNAFSIMDGMTEACIKGGIEACYAAVSCVCTLLGALDELSQGKGYTAGVGMSIGTTFGRIAGQEAARAARKEARHEAA